MVGDARRTKTRGKQSRRDSEKLPSWWRSAAILTVSAVAAVAYLSAVARTTSEILWAWSVLLFVLSLGACGVTSWSRTESQPIDRALQVAARLSFIMMSSLVVASTAYRFEGPEVALFAGLIWLVIVVFAPLADL